MRHFNDLISSLQKGEESMWESTPGAGAQRDCPGSESQAVGHGQDMEGSSPNSSPETLSSEAISKKRGVKNYILTLRIIRIEPSQNALTYVGLAGPHFSSERCKNISPYFRSGDALLTLQPGMTCSLKLQPPPFLSGH